MINQYIIQKTLGSGSFATVKLCQDTKTKILYAIKIMSKKTLQSKKCGNKTAYDCVREELLVL